MLEFPVENGGGLQIVEIFHLQADAAPPEAELPRPLQDRAGVDPVAAGSHAIAHLFEGLLPAKVVQGHGQAGGAAVGAVSLLYPGDVALTATVLTQPRQGRKEHPAAVASHHGPRSTPAGRV